MLAPVEQAEAQPHVEEPELRGGAQRAEALPQPETRTVGELAAGVADRLFDAIERGDADALALVFEETGRSDRQWCALGSVKSNIGHLKAAAGAAGDEETAFDALELIDIEYEELPALLDVHEAMNFAAVRQLPVVLFCTNNQYAYSTPLRYQMAITDVVERAKAYGMPGVRVDGNDLLAVYQATQQALARAPLRETLAAGMLLAAGWPETEPLIDPLCGSGTIAIEAARTGGIGAEIAAGTPDRLPAVRQLDPAW